MLSSSELEWWSPQVENFFDDNRFSGGVLSLFDDQRLTGGVSDWTMMIGSGAYSTSRFNLAIPLR